MGRSICEWICGHRAFSIFKSEPPEGGTPSLVEPLNGDTTGRAKGPALGLFGDSHFSTHRRKLEAGDLIALYTDGLIEINSADEQQIFTPELLAAAVRQQAQLPATELLEEVISDIKKFSGQPDFEDDVCLIGIEVKRLGQPAGKTAPAPAALAPV